MSQIKACGLDFGTSNSTLAVYANGQPELIKLEDDRSTVPSATFFGHEKDNTFLVGRAAINAYVDGAPGRLMRSLKSILGNALLHERTPVFRRKISFAEIIGQYLKELKHRAELQTGKELTQVVMGRPVQFVDNDEAASAMAENNLRTIAKSIGFKDVSFEFEPVAAALEFERQLTTEKLALIADLGGGTSDFSIIRLGGQHNQKVLANTGVRVGGTDFDRALSIAKFMPSFGYHSLQKASGLELPVAPFLDLSTWSSIHNLYEPKFMTLLKALRFDAQQPNLLERFIHIVNERRCHSLLMNVEQVKMQLSETEKAEANLDWVERKLRVLVTSAEFETSASALFAKLQMSITKCLSDAGISADKIDVLFFTGGTSLIPAVRQKIAHNFPHVEIVNGDQFGAVGMGLGLEAHNRYG